MNTQELEIKWERMTEEEEKMVDAMYQEWLKTQQEEEKGEVA